MKKFNFYIQAIMIGILLLIIAVSYLLSYPGYLISILYLQIPLGITQVIGGIGLRIVQKEQSSRLNWYLLLTFINLIAIYFFEMNYSTKTDSYLTTVLFGTPWLLAIYYWFISYQLYKAQS